MNLLECFLSKFRCLSIAGYEATLNISCKAGQTYVSLNANLGQLHSQSPPPINPTPPGFNPRRKHRGPPFFRRQIKRRFRENYQQAGAELGKAQPKLGLSRIKSLVKSRKVVWD